MASPTVFASPQPLSDRLRRGFATCRKDCRYLRVLAAHGAITYSVDDTRPSHIVRYVGNHRRHDAEFGGHGLAVRCFDSAALLVDDDGKNELLAVALVTHVPMTAVQTMTVAVAARTDKTLRVTHVLPPDDMTLPDSDFAQTSRMQLSWHRSMRSLLLLVTTNVDCRVYEYVDDKLVLRQRAMCHHSNAVATLHTNPDGTCNVIGTLQSPWTLDRFVADQGRRMTRASTADTCVFGFNDASRVVAVDHDSLLDLTMVVLADGSMQATKHGLCNEVVGPTARGDYVPSDQKRLVAQHCNLVAMAFVSSRRLAYVSVFDLRKLELVHRCMQPVGNSTRPISLHWLPDNDTLQFVTSNQVYSLAFSDGGCIDSRSCEQA
jgi:hypothetical protein